jgi:SAM-dependent methyltransferase
MWDERYAQEGFAYGTEPNDFLVEVCERIPAGPVLCLAEGEGRNAVFLAARGHQVLAVDQSPVGLEKAQRLAKERGVTIETRASDLGAFELERGRYAGIVSIWGHLPPALRKIVHGRCVGALMPGGVMILEAYTPDQVGRGTGGPPDPAFCMSRATLRDELAGLDFEVLVERERHVAEGKYHDGNSLVVQMVARKPRLADS